MFSFVTTKTRRYEAVLDVWKPLRVFVSSWFICSFLLSSIARADEQWILTTADFKSETVSIKSIDDAGVHITGDNNSDRAVPMSQFLQLDRTGATRSAPPKLFLWLNDGDHLGGTPLGISGESITWRCPSFGDLSFPLNSVRAIERASQLSPANESSRTEDVLTLANGDVLHGIISDMSATTITIQPTGGEATAVPIASVVSADFATPPGTTNRAAKLQRAFRVSTVDGTAVTTQSIRLAQRDLAVSIGGADHPVPLSSIAGIEQVNGPVIWLSAVTPIENTQIPAFSEHTLPAQMDKTVTGDPIRFNDREFAHGIGVHSYSRLVFPIEAGCKSFRTQFAIDGDAPWADVTVRIKLDGTTAFEKPHVAAGELSDVVSLDLKSARTLTLEVDYGENYDVQDRLNWIEPALIRQP
jgi:hypothetical protein